ncbi:MAG: SLC13 family permease [candidate division WOR-3 bacterium]
MKEEVSLSEVFSPALVFREAGLKSKEDVFQFVAKKLVERGIISSSEEKVVIEKLKAREEIGSTGIGNEVAIPHITLNSLKKMVGLIFQSEKGIEWEALDKKPVRLFIFLFAPEEKREEYLSTLAEVACVLNIPERLKGMLKAKRKEEIYSLLTGVERESSLSRYRNFIAFGIGLLIFYFLARYLFTRLLLPDSPPYQGFSHLNSPFWISKEIFTTTLFFSTVLGTLLFFRYRVAIAALALSLLLILRVTDIELTFKFMSIPTVLFIMAVMVMVKWFEEKGVFKFLVLQGLRFFANSPILLFLSLMFLSAILAGVVDEVSAILITFGVAMEISRQTKVNIIPYLLGLVMATNIGSALTMIGNPIGIYLGFSGGLTFIDFLRNATPIAIATALLTIPIIAFFYRRSVETKVKISLMELEKKMVIENRQEMFLALSIFLLFLILVASHTFLERLLGVEERTVLLAAPLALVGFIVFKEQERGRLFIEKGPDWWTIIFFMFLFAEAACLEYTGVTVKIAYFLTKVAKILPFNFLGESKESAGVLTLLLWGSGLLSGFVDNLPIVAALVPVAKSLSAAGMPKANLFWWALLFGGCFGGNLTMIGSTANLVAIGLYEKTYRRHFLFRDWLKIGIIITFFSLAFANFLLLLR